jgi:hypothetical protein
VADTPASWRSAISGGGSAPRRQRRRGRGDPAGVRSLVAEAVRQRVDVIQRVLAQLDDDVLAHLGRRDIDALKTALKGVMEL